MKNGPVAEMIQKILTVRNKNCNHCGRNCKEHINTQDNLKIAGE